MSWIREIVSVIERVTGVRILGRPVLRRVLQNTTFLTVGQAVSKLLTFLLLIYIGRTLGPDGYGTYSTIMAIVGVFIVVGSFGLENVLIREGARFKGKLSRFVSLYLPLKIFLALLAFGLLGVAIVASGYSMNFKILTLVYGLTLLFTSSSDAFRYIFNINQDMRVIAIASIAERLLFIVAAAVLLGVIGGVKAVILASVVSAGALLLWYAHRSTKELGEFPSFLLRVGEWRSFLDASKWFAVSGFFAIASSQLNVILVSALTSLSQAGLFAAAQNIWAGLNTPIAAVGTALLPVSSAQSRNKDYFASLRRKVLRGAGLVAVGCVVVALISNFIMRVLFGSAFESSAGILAVLVWTLPLLALMVWADQVLIATNRQKYYSVMSGVSAVANVGLNFLLIPKFGAVGSAAAFLVATSFVVVLGWFFAGKAVAAMAPSTG